MADKSKSDKKSSAKPKAAAKTSQAKPAKVVAPSEKPAAPAKSRTFYVVQESRGIVITAQKPDSKAALAECKSFAEAKQDAVERLVEVIEAIERRLWKLKQAPTFEEYERARGGD